MIYEHAGRAAARRRADAVREFTQRCTDVLEMYVRRHPELWLWMHRRWRGGSAAARDIGEILGRSSFEIACVGSEGPGLPVESSFAAIGIRQPVPNARSVTFSPGAACLRLNSASRTSRRTRRTVSRVEAGGDDLVGRLVLLDVALQDVVEDVVRRQRVLVGLVRPELGRRRLGRASPPGMTGRPRVSFSQRATRYTIVFGTSAITARPPDMSPYSVQ